MPDASPGPWTRHGHAIPGVTVAGPKPADLRVARCGGVMLCEFCREDAARIRKDAARPTATEETPAVVDTPPPSNRTEPDHEARRHPLHAVITTALAEPEGYAGADRIVRVWGRTTDDPTAGVAGNAWAGTPEDVADHLVRAIVDNVPTVDGGGFGLVPTLPVPERPAPAITTDPEEAARRQRLALLGRLPDLARAELSDGYLELPTAGQRWRVLTLAEVLGWLDGLLARTRKGSDL